MTGMNQNKATAKNTSSNTVEYLLFFMILSSPSKFLIRNS